MPTFARPVLSSSGVGWVILAGEDMDVALAKGVGAGGDVIEAWTVASSLPLMP